ncbi:hypothetical protein K431DRAFT_281052 [Polychaeton citri CBS 116435]|uniref:Transcription factor domain-containing protein n=1 Tax=Polychaeton citri CBS 116435 TaxID=1314669 RepID=A0A9P4UUD6_9PEZI|nr:hypothetical protein K431DRAFT_281052 [Polychaeton citri CBS 116435]
MLSDFLENHFPTAEAKASMAERKSYLRALPDVPISSPLLTVAIETLCLAHAGTKYMDSRLVHQSQASYGRVLHNLVKALDRPATQTQQQHHNAIIASILLLTLYNDPLPALDQNFDGWAAHYWGAQRYIESRGTSCLNFNQPFERLLLMNMRMPSLFIGVAQRSSIVFGKQEWIDYMDKRSYTARTLANLFNRTMRVPALLERTDRLLSQELDRQQLKSLCHDLCALLDDLLYWHKYEAGPSREDRIPLVDSSNLEAFDAGIEEHCFISSSSTFTTHFDFGTGHDRMKDDATLYWTFSLILNCILLRLLHFQPLTADYIAARTPGSILEDATHCATNMCRSIYSKSMENSLAVIAWVDLLVSLAQNFFEEIGAFKEFGWCQAARIATQLRLERVKATTARTLCRIADVAPGFAIVTQFKALKPLKVEFCPRAHINAGAPSRGCPVTGIT